MGEGGQLAADGGHLGGLLYLFVRGVGPTEGEVAADGVGEEEAVLRDDADGRPQLRQQVAPDVVPADEDAGGGRVEQARDEAHQGRLARAGAAEDAEGAALGNLEGDVLQQRRALELVAKAEPVDFQGAGRTAGDGVGLGGDVRFFVQDFVDALEAGGPALEHVDGKAHAHDRPAQHDQVAHEGHEIAGGEVVQNDRLPAEVQQEQQRQPADKGDQREEEAPDAHQLQVAAEVVVVTDVEGFLYPGFFDERLDYPDAGEGFLHMFGEAREALLYRFEAPADELAAEQHDDGDERQRDDGDEGQARELGEEDGQNGHRQEEAVDEGHQGHAAGHADGAHVVGRAGHDVAGAHLLVEGGGEGEQVLEDLLAQIAFDAPRGAVDEVAPAEAEEGHGQGYAHHYQHQAADRLEGEAAAGDDIGDALDELRYVQLAGVGEEEGQQAKNVVNCVPLYQRQKGFVLF